MNKNKENLQLDPELEKFKHIEYSSSKSTEEAFDALKDDPKALTKKYINLYFADKQYKQEVEESLKIPLP